MKRLCCTLLACVTVVSVCALSASIDRDINFPKNYHPKKAEALRKVIRDPQFKFLEGIVSYWEPDFGTRLSYEGDATSLNEFIAQLHQLAAFSVRLKLYTPREDQSGRNASWQLDFSQAHPDELTLYVNLTAKNLKFGDLKFPVWPSEKK